MSYISNVLVFGFRDDNALAINAWLREHDINKHDRPQQLERISMDEAGGFKSFVDHVWAAAFNYVPSDLRGFMRSLKWTHGNYAIWESEDDGFILGESWESY